MPSLYRYVAEFPLNMNGKVDRTALHEAALWAKPISQTIVRGGSPMEENVADIWRAVLDATEVEYEANFFDVGGTSLLLIAVRTALQERLGREIPITWMFECTTVRSLARRLAEPAGASVAKSNVTDNARRQREAFVRAKAARIGSR
jgi:acyl carrier protein